MGAGRTTGDPALVSSLFRTSDLMFLLYAAGDRMAVDLDRAAVKLGLKDVRDWFVLAALADGEHRTQLELSRMICLDKTTLIALLDRMEAQKLVVRAADPRDRRVRIPQITPSGRRLFNRFAAVRDAAQARALDGVDADQRSLLLQLLAHIADGEPALQTTR